MEKIQSKHKNEYVFQANKTEKGVRLVRYFSNNPSIADYKATFVCDIDYCQIGGALHVYTSICTPEDNFCKDTGVKLALQRAQNNDGFTIKLNSNPIIDQILGSLVDLFIMNDESRFITLPSYAVKKSLQNLI